MDQGASNLVEPMDRYVIMRTHAQKVVAATPQRSLVNTQLLAEIIQRTRPVPILLQEVFEPEGHASGY